MQNKSFNKQKSHTNVSKIRFTFITTPFDAQVINEFPVNYFLKRKINILKAQTHIFFICQLIYFSFFSF